MAALTVFLELSSAREAASNWRFEPEILVVCHAGISESEREIVVYLPRRSRRFRRGRRRRRSFAKYRTASPAKKKLVCQPYSKAVPVWQCFITFFFSLPLTDLGKYFKLDISVVI